MSILQNILNWLCDDSNLIKALLIALAVLVILILFRKITIWEIWWRSPKNWHPYRNRLRSDWEPERPNDLTNSFDNPWDVVSGNTDELKKSGRFGCGGIILIISLLAVIAVILFIIAKRMGLF